jgi:hypothetical protein
MTYHDFRNLAYMDFLELACLEGKGWGVDMLAKSRLWWGADEGLAAYLVLLLCNFGGAMLQFSVLLLTGIMGMFCIVFSWFYSYSFGYLTKCLKDVSPKNGVILGEGDRKLKVS